MQLVARLVGHKASINALISIAGKEPGAPEWILSGAADGSLGVWDLTKPPQGVDREITPRHLLPRAHEGAVYSMTLFQSVIDSPENPPVRLLTAGGACSCFCTSNSKMIQTSTGHMRYFFMRAFGKHTTCAAGIAKASRVHEILVLQCIEDCAKISHPCNVESQVLGGEKPVLTILARTLFQ